MIVGFDGTILREPKTGIGYYTYFLIRYLAGQGDMEPRVFDGLRMTTASSAGTAAGGESGRARKIVSTLRSSTLARALWRQARSVSFRRISGEVDIFHATNYLPPGPIGVPWLPLIHDVSHLRHPEWHPVERVRFLERRSGEFARAPLVNTVSRFSASEIEATLAIPADRIRVTYPGTNPFYEVPAPPREVKETLAAVDVQPGRFFLSVGTLEPRKNLTTIIAAYEALPMTRKAKFPLIVVGPPGWGDLRLPSGAQALERAGALRFVGYANEPTMRALYQECAAFLFPSSYEGFGMPVSEALAMGARPIVARGGAPEEVADGHGIALDPFDTDAWRQALIRAAEENWHGDVLLRQQLGQAGKRFSWQENALATRRIYQDLVGASG